jgi:short-subunit dehydrogenase
MRWEEATVVVTGASRGIGRAIAAAAAARGARLGLIARSTDALTALRDELGGPGRVTIASADVGDRQQLESALATITGDLGGVDVLVNNAGIGCWGPFVDIDAEELERVLAVNLTAAMHLTRLVLPGMLRAGRGQVVNVGSVAGRLGAPFEAVYSASKFGLTGFTEALAVEVRSSGVQVSMVNPGPVATGFNAASGGRAYARQRPRPVSAERVAAVVIATVEQGGLERVIPRWLRFAHLVRTVAPGVYARGAARAVAPQLADLDRRWAARRPT